MAYTTSQSRQWWEDVAAAYGGTPGAWSAANPSLGDGPLFPPRQTLTAPAGIGGYVNINTATAALLADLPGIGKVKARAIVKHRKKHGRFKTSKHLIEVNGIGEHTHARLKRHVRLSG